jgi:hypothetical protein
MFIFDSGLGIQLQIPTPRRTDEVALDSGAYDQGFGSFSSGSNQLTG